MKNKILIVCVLMTFTSSLFAVTDLCSVNFYGYDKPGDTPAVLLTKQEFTSKYTLNNLRNSGAYRQTQTHATLTLTYSSQDNVETCDSLSKKAWWPWKHHYYFREILFGIV